MERGHLLREPGRRDGQGDPSLATFGGDQVQGHEQRSLVVDDVAALVDECDALAHRVEVHTERGA